MRHAKGVVTGAVVFLAFAGTMLPALAQERLYEGMPKIASIVTDAAGNVRLHYAIGAETADVVADLACDANRNPDIEVHVPQDVAFEWLGGNNDPAGPPPALLSLGTVQTRIDMTSLYYDAELGNWAIGFAWSGVRQRRPGTACRGN